MDPVLKTAHEWLDEKNEQDDDNLTSIHDADGWRNDDGVDLNTPITQEDFNERLNRCTLMSRPK